ncbi:30S ribosomal protein S13 [Nanobdella aerobiophila]|uniref:Small ribosomal subunit protein uS13 n=1 Tax=Nanobdella aerobiophila TaxID=2586965 RepID=A0A915SA12_9ARCH|nr:30S ribosomal protein S13 [Nanobdella aerobiophila]BBL45427.1 30S ribosomal protein S13 [Nanobdella aerobiophila]
MPNKSKSIVSEENNIKDVIRLAGVEINGHRPVYLELLKIPGVNWRFSNAVCFVLNLEKNRPIGSLSDEELEKLEDCLKNPLKYNIPEWFLNRRKDIYDGKSKHIVGSDLQIQVKFDIKREIDLGTWKGNRHQYKLPVRGQKTRSHHRFGRSVGVVKNKEQRSQQEKQQ